MGRESGSSHGQSAGWEGENRTAVATDGGETYTRQSYGRKRGGALVSSKHDELARRDRREEAWRKQRNGGKSG